MNELLKSAGAMLRESGRGIANHEEHNYEMMENLSKALEQMHGAITSIHTYLVQAYNGEKPEQKACAEAERDTATIELQGNRIRALIAERDFSQNESNQLLVCLKEITRKAHMPPMDALCTDAQVHPLLIREARALIAKIEGGKV